MKTNLGQFWKVWRKTLGAKAGQNTAEYLLMLSIIGVGSIGIFGAFSRQIKTQFAAISGALSGDVKKYTEAKTSGKTLATSTLTKANAKVNSGDFTADELGSAEGAGTP